MESPFIHNSSRAWLEVKPPVTSHIWQYSFMARKEIREILAASLKALMKTTPGMGSQPKVAARSKVGQTTVGRILRADVMAEYETIDSLARAFGRTPEQLLSPSFADELLASALGKTQQGAYVDTSTKKEKNAAAIVVSQPERELLDAYHKMQAFSEGQAKTLLSKQLKDWMDSIAEAFPEQQQKHRAVLGSGPTKPGAPKGGKTKKRLAKPELERTRK